MGLCHGAGGSCAWFDPCHGGDGVCGHPPGQAPRAAGRWHSLGVRSLQRGGCWEAPRAALQLAVSSIHPSVSPNSSCAGGWHRPLRPALHPGATCRAEAGRPALQEGLLLLPSQPHQFLLCSVLGGLGLPHQAPMEPPALLCSPPVLPTAPQGARAGIRTPGEGADEALTFLSLC